MPKTILVPTDYTIRSLHILKHVVDREQSGRLDIVFFSGVVLQDSITELLYFSKRTTIENLITAEFKEACQIIRNKYARQISSMRYDIFTGLTQAAFENFLEGNSIDKLYIPQNALQYGARCFDPTPYMLKSALPKLMVSLPETRESSQPDHLNELFTSWT